MNWRVGVVGSPIEHSWSPLLHETGLALAGLRGSSERVEIGLDDADQLGELLATRFDALAVTSPLKEVALAVCDEVSPVALRTRSVNSLAVRGGEVHGTSTDGDGFVDALRAAFGPVVEDAHAVVLGTGGAARAIVDALVSYGVGTVVVHGRNEAHVAELVGRYPNVHSRSFVYRPVDLVVHTVPSGVRAREAAVLQGVRRDTIAVDISYDPPLTAWRALYEQAGCRTMNGRAMLAYQAARQMSWWWGVTLEGAELLEVLP